MDSSFEKREFNMPKAKKAMKSKKTATPKKKKSQLSKRTKSKNVKKKSPKKKAIKKVSALPKGYLHITPYLIVNEAASALEFYKKVFGAKEVMRMQREANKIGHAEIKIGDAKIMLADECPESNVIPPTKLGGSSVLIHLYVKNVDDVINQALSLGAKLVKPIENMFYGDRSGSIEDPYGHCWCVATHIEDVSPAQLKKRMSDLFGSGIV